MLESGPGPDVILIARSSSSQARSWFIDQVAQSSAPNTLFFGLRIEGELQVPALELALQHIVARHEVLRTTFSANGGQLTQVIHRRVALTVQVEDCADEGKAYAYALRAVSTPFDLARGPLLRLTVLELGLERHILVVTAHHIITDAWSLRLLTAELGASYAAYCEASDPDLHPVLLQYADYAIWQAEWLESERAERQLAYWRDVLAGLPALAGRPGRERSSSSFDGASSVIRIENEDIRRLRRLAATVRATPYTVLLALLHIALWQRTGERDTAIGIAVAGRVDVEWEQVLGPFANIVPVRAVLDAEEPFADMLRKVRDAMLGAVSNQEVPFEKLVSALNARRSSGRMPIFDVLFTSIQAPASGGWFGPLRVLPYPMETLATGFDLSVHLIEEEDGPLWLRAEYRTALFSLEEVAGLLRHCLLLARQAADDPETLVGMLPRAAVRSPSAPLSLDPQARAVEWPADAGSGAGDGNERLMVRLWAETLKQPVSQRDVSFFDAGGDSLLLASLATRAAREIGFKVPVSLLLEEPTISGMAKRLSRRWQQAAITPLQPHGSRPPLFCAVPNWTHREEFSRALGRDQPVYLLDSVGMQERRMTAGEDMLETVEEVASAFTVEVVRMYPTGPVLLAGMCDGGLYALELGLQLQALGREVALLAQFDTPTGAYPRRRVIDRVRQSLWRIRSGHIEELLRGASSFARAALQPMAPRKAPAPPENTYRRTWELIWRQVRVYQPAKRFEGRVELFRARRRSGDFAEDVAVGWALRASRGVRIHDVPAEHNAILLDPISLAQISIVVEEAVRGHIV